MVIIFGNIINTIIFALIMGLCKLFQVCWNRVPKIIYKFSSSFGIAWITDFLLIALVDICFKNWTWG